MSVLIGHTSGSDPDTAANAAAAMIRMALDYDVVGPDIDVVAENHWLAVWPLQYGRITAVIASTANTVSGPVTIAVRSNNSPIVNGNVVIQTGNRAAKATSILIPSPAELDNLTVEVVSAPTYPAPKGLRIAFVLADLYVPA